MHKIHLNVLLNLDGSLEEKAYRQALYFYAEAHNNYIDAVANKVMMHEELKQYHAMIKQLKNLFGNGDFISYWSSELKGRLCELVDKFIRDEYPNPDLKKHEKTELQYLREQVTKLKLDNYSLRDENDNLNDQIYNDNLKEQQP